MLDHIILKCTDIIYINKEQCYKYSIVCFELYNLNQLN